MIQQRTVIAYVDEMQARHGEGLGTAAHLSSGETWRGCAAALSWTRKRTVVAGEGGVAPIVVVAGVLARRSPTKLRRRRA
jgi:hypothetical protein